MSLSRVPFQECDQRPLCDSIASELKEQFGISHLAALQRPCWNFVFSGTAPRGRFFVKVLRAGPERRINGAVEVGAQIAYALANAGVHGVVAPLRNADGDLVTQLATSKLLVYPWIEGSTGITSIAHNPIEHIQQVAHALARLHVSLGKLDEKGIRARSTSSDASPFSYSPASWAASASLLWSSVRTRVDCNHDLLTVLKVAEAETESLFASNPEFFGLIQADQFLHGDFCLENLMVAAGRLYIIDFDMCHRGSIAEDVAYTALAISGSRWLMGPRNGRVILRFFDEYNAERQRSSAVEVSRRELSTALVWSALKGLSLSYKAEQLFGRAAALRSIKNLVNSRRYLEIQHFARPPRSSQAWTASTQSQTITAGSLWF